MLSAAISQNKYWLTVRVTSTRVNSVGTAMSEPRAQMSGSPYLILILSLFLLLLLLLLYLLELRSITKQNKTRDIQRGHTWKKVATTRRRPIDRIGTWQRQTWAQFWTKSSGYKWLKLLKQNGKNKMNAYWLGSWLLDKMPYSTKSGTHHDRPPSTNEANVKPRVIHTNVLLFF